MPIPRSVRVSSRRDLIQSCSCPLHFFNDDRCFSRPREGLQFRILLVHPGLLWVKAQTAAVEEDGRFEILAVSEAAYTAFD